jgi:transposase
MLKYEHILYTGHGVRNMASIVLVKAANGTVYAYENISYWDKSTKTTQHKRKCIGHVDETSGEVVPNRKKAEKCTPSKARQLCSVMGIGVSLLLDRIAEESGLVRTLRAVFANDWQQIMTCAYYLVSEGNALSRAEYWSAANSTPYGGILTSQRVSELFTRITNGRQIDFFSKWVDHNRNGGYYAMDMTSISSYSGLIDFVRYGYNRDKEKLPQVNLLMVSGQANHIPLYFRVLPGSIKDVSTLCETLETLDAIDAKRLHLVMDKGFYSETNIGEMYGKHIRFLVGVPFTAGYANELVKKARAEEIRSHENYRRIFEDEVYAKSELTNWKGHRFYTHVYFDSLKAELENKKFDRKLYDCFKELEEGKTDKEQKAFYRKFFRVKETPKRGCKVEYNQEAIDKHRENTTGWFVLVSNDIKDTVNALGIYRMKDTAEKAFDDLKNDLDCKRLRIHSNQAMEGRLFIQFIALILSAKIKHIMNEAGWFRNHDMQQIIDEMKSLREVKRDGHHKKIISTPTAFQEKIIQLFGLFV